MLKEILFTRFITSAGDRWLSSALNFPHCRNIRVGHSSLMQND